MHPPLPLPSSKKPHQPAYLLVLLGLPNSNTEWSTYDHVSQCLPPLQAPAKLTESDSHECPVSDGKPFCQWVEWDVASWSFRVMVWRAQLSTGRVEATAGDH
jgi:hypothetical protein